MENNNNFIAGVSVVEGGIEALIRDSERLEVITEYVKNTEYVNRNTLLILLGFEPEENKNI